MEIMMKLVIQRVNYASVTIDGKKTAEISKGLLILAGFSNEDSKEDIVKIVDKIIKLRIFEDENGKTNLSINDINGSLMIVSQFTLYANCKKGNRPSFENAGSPQLAEELYNYMIEYANSTGIMVEHGEFAADMKIALENNGPFTVILP